jgi:hypothetical protein
MQEAYGELHYGGHEEKAEEAIPAMEETKTKEYETPMRGEM